MCFTEETLLLDWWNQRCSVQRPTSRSQWGRLRIPKIVLFWTGEQRVTPTIQQECGLESLKSGVLIQQEKVDTEGRSPRKYSIFHNYANDLDHPETHWQKNKNLDAGSIQDSFWLLSHVFFLVFWNALLVAFDLYFLSASVTLWWKALWCLPLWTHSLWDFTYFHSWGEDLKLWWPNVQNKSWSM